MHFVLLCMIFCRKSHIADLFSHQDNTPAGQAKRDLKLNTYLEALNALDVFLDQPRIDKKKTLTLEIRAARNKLLLVCEDQKIISAYEKLINESNTKEPKILLNAFRSLLRKDLGFDHKLL